MGESKYKLNIACGPVTMTKGIQRHCEKLMESGLTKVDSRSGFTEKWIHGSGFTKWIHEKSGFTEVDSRSGFTRKVDSQKWIHGSGLTRKVDSRKWIHKVDVSGRRRSEDMPSHEGVFSTNIM